MTIRAYQPKDFDNVRRICLATCSDPVLLKHHDVLYALFSDYYTLEEPENAFVGVNEKDEAVGYILCSTDAPKYKKLWREKYAQQVKGKGSSRLFYRDLIASEFLRMAQKGYPAHLHIDLDPCAQHQGLGTKLMEALLTHLKEKGVSGVYLGCGASNKVGNAFYQKCGFTLYQKKIGENIYTKDLK